MEREVRTLSPGERLWNGAIVSEALAETYNAISRKIGEIERSGRSVPEHLLNGRHNLLDNVQSAK